MSAVPSWVGYTILVVLSVACIIGWIAIWRYVAGMVDDLTTLPPDDLDPDQRAALDRYRAATRGTDR